MPADPPERRSCEGCRWLDPTPIGQLDSKRRWCHRYQAVFGEDGETPMEKALGCWTAQENADD